MSPHLNCVGFPIPLARIIKGTVNKCLRVLPPKLSLSVIGVDDIEMTRMNREFRKLNKTTDVLTFVDPGHVEVYISLEVARRQARERKITLQQECQRLLVHGLCHAAGMDHHTMAEFQEMRRHEFEVLVQCGIE